MDANVVVAAGKKAPATEGAMPADGATIAAYCSERRSRQIPFERQLLDKPDRGVRHHLISIAPLAERIIRADERNIIVNEFIPAGSSGRPKRHKPTAVYFENLWSRTLCTAAPKLGAKAVLRTKPCRR